MSTIKRARQGSLTTSVGAMSARNAVLEELPRRETFLHQAANKGTEKAMRKACKKLASAMKKGGSAVSEALRSWDANGCTPLHTLAKQGNDDGLALLLATISAGESSAKSQVSMKGVLDLPQEVSGDTALHVAVDNHHTGCVDQLLGSGATVNARNRTQKTALMLAVAHCDLSLVRTLIAHSADLNLPDLTGKSPLHVAAQGGDVELMRVLLKAGALVNWTTQENTTPLHLAAKMNRVEVLRELLSVGAHVNVAGPRDRSALHLAVCGSSMPTLRLLLEADADVDAQDAEGCTCVHLAAEHSTVECLRQLLKDGADLSLCDSHGRLPLHRAAQEGRLDVCEVLLEHGEQLLDARDSTRHTPLHLAMANGKATTCDLLIDRGADLRATNHAGQTPLHLAAAAGCPAELVRKMLAHGADPTQLDAAAHSPAFYALQLRIVPMAATLLLMPHASFEPGPDGSTPLHQAARLGLVDAAQQLIQQSKLPAVQFLDVTDAEGRTPLLLACLRGSAPLMELLVSKGAGANALANNGDTCMMAGLRSQSVELLRVLLEANAEISRDQLAEHTSTLHYALLHDQAEMAELILIHTKDNARKHTADTKGRTPLMLAAHTHNQSCLNWLVVAGEAFVRAPDHAGRTALHYACATLEEDVPAVLSLVRRDHSVCASCSCTLGALGLARVLGLSLLLSRSRPPCVSLSVSRTFLYSSSAARLCAPLPRIPCVLFSCGCVVFSEYAGVLVYFHCQ
jgi:ankyrin repeat protein